MAFDHHADPLNYRVSNLGVASNPDTVVWSTALFGPVTSSLGSAGPAPAVTYPSSSNTSLLPQSGLSITGTGSNRALQLSPTSGKSGMTTVTVTVDDGTYQSEESFVLTITGPVHEIYSSSMDASVREALGVIDVENVTTLLGTGGSSPRIDRCTVYVFQLPDFGNVPSPFTSASFSFQYAAKQEDLHNNDLYGLERRPSPEVLASDYYGKTAAPDPTASLLEAGILTDGSSLGIISTSPNGQNALNDFLNLQYASGVGAGQFVFLRLNTAGNSDSIDRATLTMSEGASSSPLDTRPRISITTEAFTNQHNWRAEHFGTPINAGDGADDADPNFDGEFNLLEFATGQSPHASTLSATPLVLSGKDVDFTYTRSSAALADGFIFTVEWNDSLDPDSWRQDGVTETIESDNGSIQTVIATVPADGSPRRFIRLDASQP